MQKKCKKIWSIQKKAVPLHPLSFEEHFYAPSGGGQFPRLTGTLPGAIAQLVEQRTENPCVPSSILGGTTKNDLTRVVFCVYRALLSIKNARGLAYIKIFLYLCTRF